VGHYGIWVYYKFKTGFLLPFDAYITTLFDGFDLTMMWCLYGAKHV